ncbi:MAG: hypothetical protein ACLFSQ_06910 [Candidatus Zixiibacteriota bacterium]
MKKKRWSSDEKLEIVLDLTETAKLTEDIMTKMVILKKLIKEFAETVFLNEDSKKQV